MMEAILNSIKWSDVLPEGESSAISGVQLAERLGIKDTREVRRMVNEARLAGVPVCSRQGRGYFLPDLSRMDEVEHTANELRARAITSLRQVKAINQWIADQRGEETHFEQMSIKDFMMED